jgi:DNA-binding NtrC family response regulator
MARGSNGQSRDLPGPRVWQTLHSFFVGARSPRRAIPARTAIVALTVSEQDRNVLTSIAQQEPFDIHFAESCEDASKMASQLTAPMILFDRNWPGTDWRMAVEQLAASPHHACVILMSGVADDYLWQELIRRGGYDILPKPLRNDNVIRVIKLALSYLNSERKPAGLARNS